MVTTLGGFRFHRNTKLLTSKELNDEVTTNNNSIALNFKYDIHMKDFINDHFRRMTMSEKALMMSL